MYAGSISLVLAGAACCAGAAAQSAGERECYSTVETRDRILASGLSEPFPAMQRAAARLHAEAIGVRLCRWEDELVYEISLLRRDGRLIRSYIDAKTGQTFDAKADQKHDD
jgi:uncharacterized membrane protein YkoI